MPKCGNCKRNHPTVEDVRNCYNGIACEMPMETPEDIAAAKRLDELAKVGGNGDNDPMWPASEAQIKYVLGLQDERRLPDDWTIRDEATLKRMEKDEVSSLITMLKAFPRGEAKPSRYSMPPGRYALGHAQLDTLRFYEVQHGKKGSRWEGYTFVKRLVGSPGQYRKEDMSPQMRADVLNQIQANPKEASTKYGKESKVCGVCSSPLTNAESLKAGIGPICRGKVGW